MLMEIVEIEEMLEEDYKEENKFQEGKFIYKYNKGIFFVEN